MNDVPTFATHYFLASSKPFRNLSDVPESEIDAVISDLSNGAGAQSKRVFGRRYMKLRKLTEEKLRRLFIEAGGKPERLAPHYLVLGTSDWFKGLSAETLELRIGLDVLSEDIVSATYADSFTAMGFGPLFGLPYEEKVYHNRVFKLADLPGLIAEHGLPADLIDPDYQGYANRPFEKYIEIQIWSDDPVRQFLD
ncbi:hypothetical protein [Phyllobacterium sp. K27]